MLLTIFGKPARPQSHMIHTPHMLCTDAGTAVGSGANWCRLKQDRLQDCHQIEVFPPTARVSCCSGLHQKGDHSSSRVACLLLVAAQASTACHSALCCLVSFHLLLFSLNDGSQSHNSRSCGFQSKVHRCSPDSQCLPHLHLVPPLQLGHSCQQHFAQSKADAQASFQMQYSKGGRCHEDFALHTSLVR